MQVEADPNQLRYTASLFSNGANDLRQKAKRLEDIQNGLVQGQNSWKGEGAQGFSTTMEKIQSEIQQKAGILEEAAQILIRFAYQMDNVIQIRNQASNLERTLGSFSGDSEATFQERQSISFQVNQLLQEAEWQANAADAQATSALNSLSIPMPDFHAGLNHATNSVEEELEGLSATEKSYYRRHKDLIGDLNSTAQDMASPTLWDNLDLIMAGGVDGTKEFVFGLLSSIAHPVETFDNLKFELTNPKIFIESLKSKGEEIKSDWKKGNWYGLSKIITETMWGVLLSKNLGLSENAADKATDIAQTGIDALKNLNKPTAQVVLSDGTVIRVSQDVLKSNEELADYLEQASIRNGHLAGSEHPKTQVPFDADGYPKFDSKFDAKLDPSQYTSSDPVQFKIATKQLYKEIQQNPNLGKQFSKQQLEQISEGITPKGYTWHHSQVEGVLQLVDKETHKLTGHTGGRSIWGGGTSQR